MADTQIHALIVDDEAPLREILKISLTYFGIHVEAEASNGLEAVERYKKGGLNVVIMDIQMPKMNGLDALVEIRKHDPDAIVILVTASDDVAMRQEGIKRGARGFLRKPLKMDELNEDVRTHLRILFAKQQGVELTEDYYRYVVKRDFVPEGSLHEHQLKPIDSAAGSSGAAGPTPASQAVGSAPDTASRSASAGTPGVGTSTNRGSADGAAATSPHASGSSNGAELVLADQLHHAREEIDVLKRELAEAKARLSRIAHEIRTFAQKIAHETEGA